MMVFFSFSQTAVSWPESCSGISSRNTVLQAQGILQENRVLVELELIKMMALKNYTFSEINAALDECYHEKGTKRSLLHMTQIPKINGNSMQIEVKFLRGTKKGRTIRLVLPCKDLKRVENGQNNVKSETRNEDYLVHIGAEIKDGKRIGGELISVGGNRKTLYTLIMEYPDCVIEKMRLNSEGGFSFNKENYWTVMAGYKNALVLVEVIKGRTMRVYDEKGNRLYPPEKNLVYINAEITDGKRIGGELIGSAFTTAELNKIIAEHSHCVVERIKLGINGRFGFNNKVYWQTMAGYKNVLVTVEVINGQAVGVYDTRGLKLYPASENLLFVGGRIKDGKRVGGEFVSGTLHKLELNKMIKANPDCIIEKVRLTKQGGLKINKICYWQTMPGYENALVTIVIAQGRVKDVYGPRGACIYPLSENFVYVNSQIKEGKRVGGKFVESRSNKDSLNWLVKKYPSCIIEKVILNKKGGLLLNRKSYWYSMPGYENAPVTIEMAEADVKKVYDKKGIQIYPFNKNHVYINAKIKNGRRSGGELTRTAGSRKMLNKLIEKYPDCVIEKVKLDCDGGLTFNKQCYWSMLKFYENAFVMVKVVNAWVMEVYDEGGIQLYPFCENQIYMNAIIRNGTKVGGIFIGIASDEKQLIRLINEYPDCVITKVKLNGRGGFEFNGKTYWKEMPGHENSFVTIGFKKGEITGIYDEQRSRLYPAKKSQIYTNAEIKNGKRIGGNFVGEVGNQKELKRMCNIYSDCVIENWQLGIYGRFRINKELLWHRKKGYENAKLTVAIVEGKVTRVYDKQGGLVYPFEKNCVFTGAIIRRGKKVNGEFVGSAENAEELGKMVKKYPNSIIEKVSLDSKGGFEFNGKTYWKEMKGYENVLVTIEIVNGNVTSVHNEQCVCLYPADENLFFVNATIEHGKMISGEFIAKGKSKRECCKLIAEYPNCVVSKKRLNPKGGLIFNRKIYWQGMKGYENSLVLVEVKDGEVIAVYDEGGKRIHPFTENYIYVDAEIKSGRRVGGEFIGTANNKKKLNSIISKNTGKKFVIEKVKLDQKGGLEFFKKTCFRALKGYENAYVTLESENGKVINLYDEQGTSLFLKDESKVYVNAEIMNGKRMGGAFVGRGINRKRLGILINRYPDCVVEGVKLDNIGSLKLDGKCYWNGLKDYEGALITIEIANGEAIGAYDEKGKQIYPAKRNMVYTNAVIKDGKRVGGELVDTAMTVNGLNSVITRYPYCIVEKLKLSKEGGLRLNGKYYWKSLCEHKNAIVTAKVENGEVIEVYDEKGKQIYPAKENMVYVNASIKDGKRVGGEFISSLMNKSGLNKLIQKYPDCIVDKLRVDRKGGVCFNNKWYWHAKKGYENAFVTVEIVNGEPVGIYDEQGIQLFVEKEDQTARGIKIYNKLWEQGDIEKLMSLFGRESSNRILLRFFDCFTPESLLYLSERFLHSLPIRQKKRIMNRKKYETNSDKIFEQIGTIKMFQEEREWTDLEILTDELIKLVYSHVAKDYLFLDKLKKQTAYNAKVSSFLKNAYRNTIKHYGQLGEFVPGGIQTSTQLKFYQKMGIKFILDKKRVILADEPGLGKTVQALVSAVNAYGGRGARKVLILCPRISKINVWEKQINEHLRGEQEVMIINKRKSLDSLYGKNKAKKARFIIANCELIRGPGGKRLLENITDLGIDFQIIDEAHRMRNDSQLAKAVMDLDPDSDVPYKVLITGTPLVGRRPAKLFNLFHLLYPERYSNKKMFKKKCDGKNGVVWLKNEMKFFVIRRYSSDVLINLPDLNVEIRPVDMPKEQADLYRKIEKNMMQDEYVPLGFRLDLLKRAATDTRLVKTLLFTDIETGEKQEMKPGTYSIVIGGVRYRLNINDSKKKIDISLYLEKTNTKVRKQMIHYGDTTILGGKRYKVDVIERPSYSAKYDMLDAIVQDVLNDKHEKLVIFTNIVKVVQDLKLRYEGKGYEVMCMHGKVSTAQRESIITEFNKCERPIIFISTAQTGGESIELFGAHYGASLNEPWTHQERAQKIRRLYRFGQKDDVTFYIIQARRTIDERIESIIAQGEFLEKIILDDPDWTYNSQSEIAEKILTKKKDYEKDLFALQEIQKKTRSQQKMNSKEEIEVPFFDSIKKGSELFIQYKEGVFEKRLLLEDGTVIKEANISEILINLEKLSDDSKELLKDFFMQRFDSECRKKTKVKDMILWYVCTELIPGFKDIDYHGRLELMIETGTYVVRKIIETHDVGEEEIRGELGNVSTKLYEDAMYYLDSANILKFFSYIGLIPQTYYYEGKLLKYTPPIKVYFSHGNKEYSGEKIVRGGIRYYDEKIVENIAPEWRRKESEISSRITGFNRDSEGTRKLNRSEEIRLARQLELGNKAAEIVLVGAYLRDVLPVAKKLKKMLYFRFGSKLANAAEIDEICDVGRTILMDLVKRYAEFGAYETQPLKDYLQSRLTPRMYGWGYKRINEIKELTADNGAYGGKDDEEPTRVDLEREEAVASVAVAEKETMDIMEQLLQTKGFNDTEIRVIESFVYEGYTEQELMDWTDENNFGVFGKDEIKAIISRFQNFITNMGKARFKDILENGLGSDFEIKKDQVYSKQKHISDKNHDVFSVLKTGLMNMSCKHSIDIVVDLSLMPEGASDALHKSIDTWAHLILLCKDFDNVDFIFEDTATFVEGKELPSHLDAKGGTAKKRMVLESLRSAIRDKAIFFGEDNGREELIANRVRGCQNRERKETKTTIEIPIISIELAEWMRDEDIKLEDRQYPVVMETGFLGYEDGIAIGDFESALMIGLAKACLVIAKNKKQRILIKLDGLYRAIRREENHIILTDELLEYMIDASSRHRLNRAIDFCIPPITCMPVDQIQYSHENAREFQLNM